MLVKFDLPKPGVSKVFPILAAVPKTIKLNYSALTKQTSRVEDVVCQNKMGQH